MNVALSNEPRHKKTGFLQMRKQRRRSASQFLCENKGADQLRSNCEADQRLCFRYTDSTLSLLNKSEISSFYAASGTVHVGLCQTWLETPKTGLNFEMMFNRIFNGKKDKCIT